MIPLAKLATLLIRILTRPLTTLMKSYLKSNQPLENSVIRETLVSLGQSYHKFNIRLQRKSLNLSGSHTYIKPLPEDKALENGIEFFGEIVAYGTLLVLGIYELNRRTTQQRTRKAEREETISKIHARIEGLESQYEALRTEIHQLAQSFEELNKKTSEKEFLEK